MAESQDYERGREGIEGIPQRGLTKVAHPVVLQFGESSPPRRAVSSIPFLKGQNQVARDCVRQVMHWIRIESVLIWVHVDTLCGEDEIAFQQFSVVSKIEIGFAAHFLAEIINPGLLLECVSFD
jgi:hypothetical protein